MTFRKYYDASLAPCRQKTIYKVLTTLWREDPFEAKWSRQNRNAVCPEALGK